MILLLTTIFFTLGLIIGSFLNVVILRYNTEKSLSGRSACMSCQQKLCWYELIPLVSFVALKGRCRSCQTKISWQYPLVELTAGVIFAGLFFKFQNVLSVDILSFSLSYAYYAAAFSLLLVISAYDLRHKIIPDGLVVVFGVVAFLGIFLFSGDNFFPHLPSFWEIGAGVAVALPFALIWLISKGAWMGLGDAKLALGLGWILGLSRVLSGVVVAFWSGAVIGILLMFLSRKYSLRSEIPFAPFLALGAFLGFIFNLNLFPAIF